MKEDVKEQKQENDVVVEAPAKETPAKEPSVKEASTENKTQSSSWIFVIIGLVALFGISVFLGLNAEKQYGTEVLKILPKNLIPTPKVISIAQPKPTEVIINKPTSAPSTTINPSSSSKPTVIITAETGYILSFSSIRAVKQEDLTGLSPWELKVARNEIYARHGRKFVSQDLACYFQKLSWYVVDPAYTDSQLSALESTNAATILNYEKEINSQLTNTDTGCR